MKVIMINGGLGNQAFQYIFYRYMEIKTGDTCYLDDRQTFDERLPDFCRYQLEKIFQVKPKKLSDFFDDESWETLLNVTVLQNKVNIVNYLQSAGISLALLAESNWYFNDHKKFEVPFTDAHFSFPANEYCPAVTDINENLYCYGYYINMGWFSEIKDVIRKEFTFPPITDYVNNKMLEEIRKTKSVAVHVRRGDFIDLGWSIPPEFYVNSVAHLKSTASDLSFYIFSDDMEWCRENTELLGFDQSDKITFVDFNEGENSFRDMQLMSNCKTMIIANSSFSYLAALLNQTPDKLVYNPTARGII